MEEQNQHQEFRLAQDKSLWVSTFLAVVIFVALFTVVRIINRQNQDYTQTTSKATNTEVLDQSQIGELEDEVFDYQYEFDEVIKEIEEPELSVNLESELAE